MRNKSVPEKKRSWLGNLGSGVGSGKRLIESVKRKMKDGNKNKTEEKKNPVAVDKTIDKKKRRFRPGTVALRDIKKQQTFTKNSIAVSSLDKIIREIASRMKTTVKDGDELRFQPKALAILREVAENFQTDLYRLGSTLSIHRGLKTLQQEDVRLAASLMMEPHKTYQRNGSARLLQGLTQLSGDSTRKAIKGRDEGQHGKNLRKFTDKNAEYETIPDAEDDAKAEKEFEEEDESDHSSDEESGEDESDEEQ